VFDVGQRSLVSARSYLWEFSLAGAFGMHRSRQNIHDPTNSCDRFCYEIAKNAGTLESESPFIWQVAGLVFTSRFFRSQEKLIIGEKRNDLVLQPRRAELRRRKALSKK
jgi:hypothetical protein